MPRRANPIYDVHHPHDMLAMRMRWPVAAPGSSSYLDPQSTGFSHIHVHLGNTTASVFIVRTDGIPVTIEDDANLFPSDQLITQLRILGAK